MRSFGDLVGAGFWAMTDCARGRGRGGTCYVQKWRRLTDIFIIIPASRITFEFARPERLVGYHL